MKTLKSIGRTILEFLASTFLAGLFSSLTINFKMNNMETLYYIFLSLTILSFIGIVIYWINKFVSIKARRERDQITLLKQALAFCLHDLNSKVYTGKNFEARSRLDDFIEQFQNNMKIIWGDQKSLNESSELIEDFLTEIKLLKNEPNSNQ